jgi:hypothetical protein
MDNHSVYISESRMSCGVLELSNITTDNDKVLYQLASHLYHPARGNPAAFVMWSVTVHGDTGWHLYKHIEKEFVMMQGWPDGRWCSEVAENPKTGNRIVVLGWQIPHEQFRNWYKETKIARIKNG